MAMLQGRKLQVGHTVPRQNDLGMSIENLEHLPPSTISPAERFPTRRRVRVIKVHSEFDPSSSMLCCGGATIQKQIDYQITVNDERFRVPKVWADVCETCNQAYFAPEVGAAITDRIFEKQHPMEGKIAQLLRQ